MVILFALKWADEVASFLICFASCHLAQKPREKHELWQCVGSEIYHIVC